MTQGRQDGSGDTSKIGAFGSSANLLAALDHVGAILLVQDASHRCVWARNAPRAWSADGVIGKADFEYLPAGPSKMLQAAKAEILAGGPARRMELEIPGSDGAAWYSVWIDPLTDASGKAGILTTLVEVTEQRQREQALRTLLREVSHRSKNLLAIIQSIASQTGRYAESISEFLTRFRGRLQSLSSSQDLVTSSNWRGADLAQLVTDQVARYCADPSVNMSLRGENPYLNPNAALHVGLALHELRELCQLRRAVVGRRSGGYLGQPACRRGNAAGLDGASADFPGQP